MMPTLSFFGASVFIEDPVVHVLPVGCAAPSCSQYPLQINHNVALLADNAGGYFR